MKNSAETSNKYLIEIDKLKAKITELEKTKTKDKLSKNEQFMTSLFESVQDGISVLKPDLTIRHVNGMMKKWYKDNLPLEGKKCYEVYHNADKPCEPCPTLRCLESGKTELNIVPGLPGSPIEWIELFSYPIIEKDSNKISGVIEYVRDITDRKQAEKNLRESEDRLSKTLEAANDGMWDWNLITNEVYFDPRYYQMAGYAVDEFPHNLQEFQKRISPNDVEDVMSQAQMHIMGEIPRFNVEFRFKKKNGDWLWVMGRGIIVERNKNNKPLRFIGTHTDITERKLAEKELNSRMKELEIFNDAAVDREIMINESRKEINELLKQLGKEPKYDIVE